MYLIRKLWAWFFVWRRWRVSPLQHQRNLTDLEALSADLLEGGEPCP